MMYADYLLNVPSMKGHRWGGVTMFAKNHFGWYPPVLLNSPDLSEIPRISLIMASCIRFKTQRTLPVMGIDF